MVTPLFSKALLILFPKKCIICKKFEVSVCDDCLRNCSRAIDTPALYIISIYSFRDKNIKKIIHAIKYFHRRDLIPPFVDELVQELKKTTNITLQDTGWVLAPIPMSRLRKYIRGYNQAELLAKEISFKTKIPLDTSILGRRKSPKRQVTTKNRSEREQNQHNSFKVNKDISDMNIILVDDVTTTGATLYEARKSLLKSGAHEVIAVTLAH